MAGIRAIELFAGIGGFRVASDSLGIETIWANDINPKAAKVYAANFGSITVGDINSLIDSIPAHDLLTGGFPCQPFSSAGKKLGIQDARGTLFQSIVEILTKHEPSFFVLENVKRLLHMENGAHFAAILKALTALPYQIEWRLVNATSFGLPQNRVRVVITGVHQRNLNHSQIRLANKSDLEYSDISNSTRLSDVNTGFQNWGIAKQNETRQACLPVNLTKSSSPKLSDMLQDTVPEEFDFTKSTLERIQNSVRVDSFFEGVQLLYNQAGGARMGYTVFGTEGLAPTLTSSTSRHYERYKVGSQFRRLTNVEYARLQGFSDNHCESVSIYDQYALFGNAFPPPMAKWAIERTLHPNGCDVSEFKHRGQLAIF